MTEQERKCLLVTLVVTVLVLSLIGGLLAADIISLMR
jgi:hypothetical protein